MRKCLKCSKVPRMPKVRNQTTSHTEITGNTQENAGIIEYRNYGIVEKCSNHEYTRQQTEGSRFRPPATDYAGPGNTQQSIQETTGRGRIFGRQEHDN